MKLLAWLLAGSFISMALAQGVANTESQVTGISERRLPARLLRRAGDPAIAEQLALASRSSANGVPPDSSTARDSLYYKRNWGVEIIGVKPVSSGTMLSFKYHVLDPDKAKLLNDRQTRAFLRDEATGNVLSVPAMENVGELRTGAAPVADRTYFMIFGNPGKLVKSGSRVSVVAGALHVDGLIVD
jgi:hypothetical protein